MANTNSNPPAADLEISNMSKIQKLAGLLVILGTESAAEVLKSLDDAEIEAITGEMAKLAMLNQGLQTEILKEFTHVALEAGTSVRGGPDFTQNTLEKALGLLKATNMISRVAPDRAPVAALEQIADLDSRQVFNLLKQEQPQTMALILSYLTPEKASQVLSMLRPDIRGEVVERVANLAPTPIEVVEKVVEVLVQKLDGKQTRPLRQTGGVKSAANLLNALDKNVSKTLLMAIDEKHPELGQAIRQKMFTFEDVANLDATALQKILREVDMRDLAIALKTASDGLKKALLGCISKRAAETVNEEISFMGPLKMREIDAAQNRIIEVVRRLEAEGEIELNQGDGKSNEILA
jgi:flagellar motor switch protein FliG